MKPTRTDRERAIIVRTAEVGELLGIADVFSDGTYRYTATALDPHLVRFMEARAFMSFFHTCEDVRRLVAQQFVREIEVSDHLRVVSAQPTAPSRLAHFLLIDTAQTIEDTESLLERHRYQAATVEFRLNKDRAASLGFPGNQAGGPAPPIRPSISLEATKWRD